MTKRELIEALETLDVDDNTEVWAKDDYGQFNTAVTVSISDSGYQIIIW